LYEALDKNEGVCYNAANNNKNMNIDSVTQEGVQVLEKGAPIVVPEGLTPEEAKRYKHNEKMKRYYKRKNGKEILANPTKQELRKLDTTEMVTLSKDTRNKAIQILDMKLNELSADSDALSKVNLATLATVFGILFDKTQLMTGMATENIAIQAKIDVNLKAEDALELLNKMREKSAEESTGKIIDV